MNRDIKGVNGLIDGSAERSLDKIVKAHTEDNVGTRELIYLVGNYGDDAENRDDNGVLQVYRFDNTPLSISLDRVFRLVQQDSGFRFRGATFNTFDWKNAYIASSNIKYNDVVEKEVLKVEGRFSAINVYDKIAFIKGIYDNNMHMVHESRGYPYVIEEDGYYKVSFHFDKMETINERNGFLTIVFGLASPQVWEEEVNVPKQGWENMNFAKTFYFQKGDRIYLFSMLKDADDYGQVYIEKSTFKIEKIKGNDNLSVLVSDFALTDLFKEVFKLFSLTPIRDRQTGVYDFFTLSERVNAPVIDWSSKFVRVKEVKYHSANYGQKNNFLYKKYDEENDYKQRNNDGVIHFDDKVLDDRKDFSSKFFSPLNDKENGMDVMEFFTKEVKKKEDGTTETEYKEKTGRWHVYATKEVKNEVTFSLRAKEEGGGVERYFVPNFEPCRWDNLLNTYYKDLPRVVERMYCVTVEMNLNEIDVMEFSFFSRIYVQQLGSYFMPNKIKYKTEGMAEVEMIKIR